MATTITKTIGSAGRNYSTIAGWEAATAINLVASGQIQIGMLYADSSFRENVTIAGATTNSGNYRKLTVNNPHSGWLTQGVDISGTITINYEPYFYLEGMRVRHNSPVSGYTEAISINGISGNSTFTTLNKVIVHDWTTAPHSTYSLYGIACHNTGGIKIFNSVVYNLYKDNDINTDDSMGGGIVLFGNTTDDNWVCNNTVFNYGISGWFTFLDGGISADYGNSTKTHCINNISMLNGYTDDHSSGPTPESYRYDYENLFSADSDYNAGMGGGYGDGIHDFYVPGAHSFSGISPRRVFTRAAAYDKSGNGFCGWNTYPQNPTWDPFDDVQLYPITYGESGIFTLDNQQFATTCVAGFLYVSPSVHGIASGIVTRTTSGPSTYAYGYNKLFLISGVAQPIINVSTSGGIKFNPSIFNINWTNQLLTPPTGPYTPDPHHPQFIAGTVVSGLINVGTNYEDSGGYYTNVGYIPPTDLRLRSTCTFIGSGKYLTFPELQSDIRGVARVSGAWDIGAYTYVPAVENVSYIGNTSGDFSPAQWATGRCYWVNGPQGNVSSISNWSATRGGHLSAENRKETGYVVVPEIVLPSGWNSTSSIYYAGMAKQDVDLDHYFMLAPISGQVRFSINTNGNDGGRGFQVYFVDYSKIYNMTVHNMQIINDYDWSTTGIWAQASDYVEIYNPIVYDLGMGGVTNNIAIGGIHLSGPSNDYFSSYQCTLVNPIVHTVSGTIMGHGLIVEGYGHRVYGATVFNISRRDSIDGSGNSIQRCVGIITTGQNNTFENCMSITNSLDPLAKDFIDVGSGTIWSNCLSHDNTAFGPNAIHGASASTEWKSPIMYQTYGPLPDFHLAGNALAHNNGLNLSATYAYDNDNVPRVNDSWDIGAYVWIAPPVTYPSGIITGLPFNSGIISSSSSYGSGNMVLSYLGSVPSMVLQSKIFNSGVYETGLVSMAIHSHTTDKWNFYIEAIHSSGQYILYTASGVSTDQYGLYKEDLELHISPSSIYSYDNVGYMWAQTVSGGYTTTRKPIYFRKLT